jgi:hypothetical protein
MSISYKKQMDITRDSIHSVNYLMQEEDETKLMEVTMSILANEANEEGNA